MTIYILSKSVSHSSISVNIIRLGNILNQKHGKSCRILRVRICSPEPRFETDENHSYFITTLPIHSAFLERGDALNGAIKGEEQSIQIADNKYYMFFIGSGGAINGVINGALNEAVINELVNVLRIIHNQKGINRIELIERIGKAKTTIERYLKILKENNLIEYRGAKKTGGYFLSEYALDKLKN